MMVGGGIVNKGESLIVENTVDVQVFSFPGFFFFFTRNGLPGQWVSLHVLSL